MVKEWIQRSYSLRHTKSWACGVCEGLKRHKNAAHENSSNTCLPRQKETRGANVVVCGTDESKRGREREWVGTSTNNNTFYRSKIIYSLSPVNKFRGTGRSTEQLHPTHTNCILMVN